MCNSYRTSSLQKSRSPPPRMGQLSQGKGIDALDFHMARTASTLPRSGTFLTIVAFLSYTFSQAFPCAITGGVSMNGGVWNMCQAWICLQRPRKLQTGNTLLVPHITAQQNSFARLLLQFVWCFVRSEYEASEASGGDQERRSTTLAAERRLRTVA